MPEMNRFERMTPEECEARRRALGETAAQRMLTPREWIELSDLYGAPVPDSVRASIEKEEL